jgi:hypothetical protein
MSVTEEEIKDDFFTHKSTIDDEWLQVQENLMHNGARAIESMIDYYESRTQLDIWSIYLLCKSQLDKDDVKLNNKFFNAFELKLKKRMMSNDKHISNI